MIKLSEKYKNYFSIGNANNKDIWYAEPDLEVKLSNLPSHGFIFQITRLEHKQPFINYWWGRYCLTKGVVSIATYPFKERVPKVILDQLHCIFPEAILLYYRGKKLYEIY